MTNNPRQLPKVRINGKWYYQDDKRREFREVDFHFFWEIISFDSFIKKGIKFESVDERYDSLYQQDMRIDSNAFPKVKIRGVWMFHCSGYLFSFDRPFSRIGPRAYWTDLFLDGYHIEDADEVYKQWAKCESYIFPESSRTLIPIMTPEEITKRREEVIQELLQDLGACKGCAVR